MLYKVCGINGLEALFGGVWCRGGTGLSYGPPRGMMRTERASDAAVSAGRAEPTDRQRCYSFTTNLLFARHADTGQ
jgi:hypothetical protein